MAFILLLCVIEVAWAETFSYYHELSVETFQPPKALRKDSYFGFSITYDQYNKRMIISAPRETDIGEVYECKLANITDKSCSRLATNMSREAPLYTHDYWFGATVKAGPTFVMACTPRYASTNKGCDDAAGMYGRCYVRKKNETNFSSYISPVRITPEKELHKGVMYCVRQEKKMDTLGFSLDIGEDGSIIVGGPAMFNNTGIATITPPNKNFAKRIDKRDRKIYNFGFSVAVGYFTSDVKISYAVSTTYGTVGPGKVYFYTYTNEMFDPYITLNKSVDVNVVGSMFGAVLCAVNINKLGKGDDLLVGAPTYALDTGYNTGAVYVYGYNERGVAPEFRRKIVGHKYGSMFGSAIISVGDLNGDRQDEIAIGAPFEDNGAVYLYSGSSIYSKDKTLSFLQKIKPTGKSIASFGYSMTALQDYDDNGCNELAISAPFTDRVMLYKCFAVVTVTKLYAVFPDVKNRTVSGKTDYIFQVCMDLQYPEKPKRIIAVKGKDLSGSDAEGSPSLNGTYCEEIPISGFLPTSSFFSVPDIELSTDVKMDHDYAKLKNPNNQNIYTFKIQLQGKNETYCENVEFVLPLDKDYTMQVEYKLTTALLNSPVNLQKISGENVILSDYSKVSYSGVWSATECSGNGECISNLTLNVTSDITELPLIIGSRDKGAFHIHVLNTGEVAYDPCFQFSISGGSLQTPPMYCSYLDEKWLCTSMKPISTSRTWEIRNIIVDLRDLTNQDKRVTLSLKLFDGCSDTNNSKVYEYSIPLKSYDDGVYVKGTTDIGDIVHIVEDDVLFSKHFKQIYTIINSGPTNFIGLTSTVKLQKTDFLAYSDAPVSIYVDATSLKSFSTTTDNECEVVTNNDLEIIATCPIRNLMKDSYIRVVVSLETNPDVLTYDVLKKQAHLDVNSALTVHFDKATSKRFTLTTFIHLQEGFVDLWILVAAGLVGMLLIIILTVVLYKSGFLQRKNKKKLQELKKDVRRQTIRRSMMAQSQAEVADKSKDVTEEGTMLRVPR